MDRMIYSKESSIRKLVNDYYCKKYEANKLAKKYPKKG